MDDERIVNEKQTIGIVGAGICGLCTALALQAENREITVFERDGAPPAGDADQAFFEWQRRGAAQFRHPHAFLALMCNILKDNYPDLIEEFWQAGARKVSFQDMLSPEMTANYQPEPGDEKLWLLMCRRATIETVLRRYVERQPGIEIINNVTVTGLLASAVDGCIVAGGLKLKISNDASEVRHDLVVDASGRNTRFPGWFEELGARIEVEDDDAEIVYFTRHYKLLPGVAEPGRGEDRSAGDLGYIKYGVFPGEGGHFAVILCLPNAEQALREAVKSEAQFDEICRSIPGLLPWVGAGVAEATTSSFGFGDIHAVWRHFVRDGRPHALNYFAVGDAAVRTNPLYGRGCSTGIKHAHILAEVLDAVDDPVSRAVEFDQRTEDEIRPIFKASLGEDKNGIKRAAAIREGQALDRPDSLRKWLRLSLGDAISAAARDQLHVVRGAMRTFNLLEPPGEFLSDWRIRLTILRYMFRGRGVNARSRMQRGPGRTEMLELISASTPQ